MSISPELAELAQRVGVATGYVDGTGVARVPSVEVLIAVFRALGIAIDRESDAASLLADSEALPAVPVRSTAAAPTTCAAGPQPARTWGVFAPLAGLAASPAERAAPGHIGTLAALDRTVASLGGRIVSTLPLVAGRPDDPSPYSPVTWRFWDPRWVDRSWLRGRLGGDGPGAVDHPLVQSWCADHGDAVRFVRWRSAAARHGWDPSTWSGDVSAWVRTGQGPPERAGIDPHHVAAALVDQFGVTAHLDELGAEMRAGGRALYLDLPVGVRPDSFDVWERPDLYVRGVSIGAPPDRFFPDGQSWGLAPVHPLRAAVSDFDVVRAALDAHMSVAGVLRIDHVMGLHRQFWVPDGAPAGDGTYVAFPADQLWEAVAQHSQRHGCGIVGEDLGTVPDEVRAAMAERAARGLFIAQDEVRHPFRLARTPPSAAVASLNTHDLPPVATWWAEHGDPTVPTATVRDHLLAELAASDADIVLVAEQDLSLDAVRTNLPGTVGDHNWSRRSGLDVADLDRGEARRCLGDVDRWRSTPRGAWPSGAAPFLDEADLRSLRRGVHTHVADRFGVHPVTSAGMVGAAASVWAPHATEVVIAGDFDGWSGTPLRHRALLDSPGDDPGVWEGFVPAAMLGDRYTFRLRTGDGTWIEKSDPLARAAELPPGNASILCEDEPGSGGWSDGEWLASRSVRQGSGTAMSIYEVHLGSWRRGEHGEVLGYAALADRLADHVLDLGFTHVELMPVMEHPFGGSWGYHVTGFFAPTARYGTPAEFAGFVDRLHRRGVGVILDWVPAHFPTDAHGLARFDGWSLYEYGDPREGEHPEWGSLVFDWARPEVRAFLVSSARWWVERYHVDGIRVDAVASMLYRDYAREAGSWIPNVHGGRENLEAVDLLRHLTTELHAAVPGVLVIAEESTSWPGVTHDPAHGGLGFDRKWDLGWMHDTLDYLGRDPVHRGWHHDELTFRPMYSWSERFLLPLSHDEVVHGKGSLLAKMAGDRWQQLANLRLLFGHQAFSPGVPLVFMGGELATPWEWNHDDELPWWLLDHAEHSGVRDWLRAVNRARAAYPALRELDDEAHGFEWIDCSDRERSVVAWQRNALDPAEALVVTANFTPIPRDAYRVGLPADGTWELVLNSDDRLYGGSGYPVVRSVQAQDQPHHGRTRSGEFTLGPLAISLYRGVAP
ncbi:MAG: 1,4-alpha-glucan branching protein GlgB [Microthrixaceae bacterium]|jgi:alpha-1,4-glucan:alpha-1,4-glucan 6-glycosyltransferase|nr:1,4-alpha-glucan branching protein GlgB [Microthrixaceae bacterium]